MRVVTRTSGARFMTRCAIKPPLMRVVARTEIIGFPMFRLSYDKQSWLNSIKEMFRSAEQQNFNAIVARHIEQHDAPLLIEGATGLGKTRAYLAAIANSHRRIALVLPTHQLIEQLLASSDLSAVGLTDMAAFRPARMFTTRAEYERQRDVANAERVMVCTAASVLIDHRLGGEYNGSTQRDYILFDEADQLPDMAGLQSDFAITARDLADLEIKLTSAVETLSKILEKPLRTVEPEIRAAARIILDAIESPAWYHNAGIDDDGGIVLTHKMPGRLLKKISNRPAVAFVSATLSINNKFDDFRQAMGIESASLLSEIIEPAKHGHLTFNIQPLDVDSADWLPAVVEAINRAPRPALVIVPSHTLADELAAAVPGAVVREGLGDAREDTGSAARRVSADGILIAAGAWAGLDTQIKWQSILIPRIPFGQPVVVDGQITTHYLNAKNTAIRRLRQGIGRGLRSPDAQCAVFILDGRVTKLSGFVPERFKNAWDSAVEGERVEVVLSKAERDPALRKAALKHYGIKCARCSLVPTVTCQLDVHHKHPIAEGVRRTTLNDLTVLCANCHRLVHFELRQAAMSV